MKIRITESQLRKLVKLSLLNEYEEHYKELDEYPDKPSFIGRIHVIFDADTLQPLKEVTDNSIVACITSTDYTILKNYYIPATYDCPPESDFEAECNDISDFELEDYPQRFMDDPETAEQLITCFIEKYKTQILSKLSDKNNIEKER